MGANFVDFSMLVKYNIKKCCILLDCPAKYTFLLYEKFQPMFDGEVSTYSMASEIKYNIEKGLFQ